MVNLKGGKNYKKAKGGGDDGPAFVERHADQFYGRVIKNLGNCNMIVYCGEKTLAGMWYVAQHLCLIYM